MQSPETHRYTMVDKAIVLTIVSVLSPITGLVSEIVLAWRFGSSEVVDSYRVAALVLVFGSQVFLGQVLPQVVVPLFSERLAKNGPEDAWRLAGSLIAVFGSVALIFAGWVWLYPGVLVDLLGPGLSGYAKADALGFVQYFSLAVFLMALSGVMSGVLYCYHVFWISVVSQLLTNLLMIAAIVGLGHGLGGGSIVLGILAGAVVMFLLHAYYLMNIAGRSGVAFATLLTPQRHVASVKALHLALPLLGMVAVGQWSTIMINRVFSEMPAGTLADFGYAWKLLALVGILPTSLATVIFPAFSAAGARNDVVELGRLLTRAIRMTLLLTVPAAAFLYVARTPIVRVFLDRGAMTEAALLETAGFFGVLLVGVTASVFLGILSKAFFCVQDTKAPAMASVVSAALLTWLIPYAAGIAGAMGVAWAYNAVTCMAVIGLFMYHVWRYRLVRIRDVLTYSALLALLCVGVALPAVALLSLFQSADSHLHNMLQLVHLILTGLLSLAFGYHISRLLRIHEASELWAYIRWRGAAVFAVKESTSSS